MKNQFKLRNRQKLADLYILGVGIRGVQQITLETESILRRCRIVLHLSHQDEMIRKYNRNTRDLENIYWTGETYDVVYDRIVENVLEEVDSGPGVALVTYGHPMIFDDVTLDLVEILKKRGMKCQVFPAVSCLDTICIDLGIDYGYGIQILEATTVVQSKLALNPRIDALILQLGAFQTSHTARKYNWGADYFEPLIRHLCNYYKPDHPAVIIFSDIGDIGTTLVKTRISKLNWHRRKIFPGVTLFIPRRDTGR